MFKQNMYTRKPTFHRCVRWINKTYHEHDDGRITKKYIHVDGYLIIFGITWIWILDTKHSQRCVTTHIDCLTMVSVSFWAFIWNKLKIQFWNNWLQPNTLSRFECAHMIHNWELRKMGKQPRKFDSYIYRVYKKSVLSKLCPSFQIMLKIHRVIYQMNIKWKLRSSYGHMQFYNKSVWNRFEIFKTQRKGLYKLMLCWL